MKKLFSCIALLILCLSPCCLALAPLSHGLDIIRAKSSHTVSVHESKAYTFSKEDFLQAVGGNFDEIVIKQIADSGVLKFGVDEICAGAVILKSELSALRFIPDGTKDAVFTFNTHSKSSGSDYTMILCCEKGDVPEAAGAEYETYKAVAVIQDLSEINDPSLSYHVVTTCKNGKLSMEKDGRFVYTPSANFIGRDSFEYCVKNECGQVSSPEKVEIRVRRPWRNLVFSDMIGRENHAEAIKLCETGCEKITVNSDGKPVFFPDAPLSRAEFVYWAMTSSGVEFSESESDIEEVFADKDSVSPEYAACISSAVKLGYIKGRNCNGTSLIEADSQITLGEAVTVASRILEDEKLSVGGNLSRPLTRAEGAALVFKLFEGK